MRPIGKAAAISVTNTSSTAITIGGDVTDYGSKVAFLNTGATVVACRVGAVGLCAAAVLPAAGTPSASNIVLPAAMTAPVVFDVPAFPFDITAIGSAAGPSLLYITPVE